MPAQDFRRAALRIVTDCFTKGRERFSWSKSAEVADDLACDLSPQFAGLQRLHANDTSGQVNGVEGITCASRIANLRCCRGRTRLYLSIYRNRDLRRSVLHNDFRNAT